ncbi:hypothetical protein PVAP13_6NG092300 [Panicum virgatum]|uniref:Photosystem II 10 kDa polypeptide, chloroplastic n=1 Tax=Panicum virgatum TaxID=38727 RepID=A0A8T0QVW0_PANVG|nr:hypothetical protein PVAP13_6NG092300 [Panicum virgatum]
MAASMISSSALAAPARAQGLPSLGRRASSFAVVCGTGKKIKTDKPFGIGGGLTVDHDASGRKVKGKGVYQFVDKYGANVDGYSPIYKEEDWSPTGDVYVGGKNHRTSDLVRHPHRAPCRRRPPCLQHQRPRQLATLFMHSP